MINIENLNSKRNDEITTLAMCWHLKLRNGREIGFTNHDLNLTINNLEYFAQSGFTPSAISSSNGLSVDNLDIKGIIDHEIIKTEDILAGVYDYAEISVFLVNYLSHDKEIIKLRKGWLGEVKLNKDSFVVEVRGMLQALTSAKIGEFYSNKCRASFCDAKCKLKKVDYTIENIVITKVISQNCLHFQIDDKVMQSVEAKHSKRINMIKSNMVMFNYGLVTFVSGKNKGLSMEIKYCKGDELHLVLSMPYQILAGDMFYMLAGCDKSLRSCSEIYSNAINFRGEPHIPISQKIKNNIL